MGSQLTVVFAPESVLEKVSPNGKEPNGIRAANS